MDKIVFMFELNWSLLVQEDMVTQQTIRDS